MTLFPFLGSTTGRMNIDDEYLKTMKEKQDIYFIPKALRIPAGILLNR